MNTQLIRSLDAIKRRISIAQLASILFLPTTVVTTLTATEIQLLVSGDGRGNLKPVASDYTGVTYGGLAQRASVIEDFRKQNNDVLLVEAGNFLFGESGSQSSLQAIADAYAAMGYDAINVGAADFRKGKAFTEDLLNQTKLPMVSTNLLDEKDEQPIFKPYLLIKRGGETTAILGLAEPPLTRSFLPYLDQQLEGIRFQPIQESLAQWLPQIEKKSQRIVILYAGSAVGLQQIRQVVSDSVKVIASAGPGPIVTASGGVHPLLLAPRSQGRELARATLSKNHAAKQQNSLVVGASIPPEDTVDAILNPHKNYTEASGTDPKIIIPSANAQPTSLPLAPERNRFYKISGSMRNRGANIELISAGLFEQFGSLQASEGHVLLVLRNAWENTIPLILRKNQGLATTYLVPNLGDHFYAVVNGKHLSGIYAGEATVPGQLPTKPLSLPYLGTREEGTLVFELQDEPMDSIQLRLYDYAHGHDQYDLLGLPENPESPISATTANAVVNAGIFGVTRSDTIASTQAAPDMTFVTVDFRAHSRYTIDAVASAFDPHAKAGARINIGTVADWLEADHYNHLIVDDQYAYKPRMDLSQLHANPRFLPDLMTGNRIVFEIPKDHKSLALRADFPNAKLPDGTLIRPEPIRIQLAGSPSTLPAMEPLWQAKDDTLNVSVVASNIKESFAGAQATPGKTFVVLDIALEGTGTKPEFFQTDKQLVCFDARGNKHPPHAVTYQGVRRPNEINWVPNGERRSFQVVFEVDAAETEHRFSYQGYSLAEVFALTAQGIKPLSNGVENGNAPVEPVHFEQKPIATAKSEEQANRKTPDPSVLQAEIEQPTTEYLAVIPYIEVEPKAQLAEMEKAQTVRVQQSRNEAFLKNTALDYPTLENKFGPATKIDIEAGKDEKPFIYQMELATLYQGTLETGGNDDYQFEVTEEQAKGAFEFYLAYDEFDKDTRIELEYRGQRIFQEYVAQTREIKQLILGPGPHTLTLYDPGDSAEKQYRLILRPIKRIEGMEIEFNNDLSTANPIELGETILGQVGQYDPKDYFKISIDEEQAKKVYALDVVAEHPENKFSISLYTEEEENVLSTYSSEGTITIGNFSPFPGTYYLLIQQPKDTSYRLKISEVADYVSGFEREPNDRARYGRKAVVSEVNQAGPEMSGVFRSVQSESDHFLLDVKDASQIYTLSLSGAGAETIEYLSPDGRSKMWSSKNKRLDLLPALIDMKLPVGRNLFVVRGQGSDWGVNIEAFPVPGGNFEEEPNNEMSWATTMKLGEPYYGRLLDNSDNDHFKVTIHQAMNYQLTIKPGKGSLLSVLIRDLATGVERFDMEEEDEILKQTLFLLPGQYDFHIEASTPSLEKYEITLEPLPVENSATDVSFEYTWENEAVAEHSDLFQLAQGTVKITNHSNASIQGALSFQTTHHGIHLTSIGHADLSLDVGNSVSIPLQLHVDADVWNHGPVYLYTVLTAADGSKWVSEKNSLLLDPDQLAVGSERLPQTELLPELIGGLNLASLMLGATPIEESNEAYTFDNSPPSVHDMGKLFDGIIELDSFWGHRATIKLAGDGTIPLVGTSFELHGEGSLWESAKDVVLELSDDGESWYPAWQGSLEPKTGNQQFLFQKEMKAQYARLTIKSTHAPTDTPHLGEWRVICKPGVPINGKPLDLLNEANGGHLIRETETSRVFGFHHNRAAKIDALGWTIPYPSNASNQNVHHLKLSTSMDSPVGPWKTYGDIDVSAADNEAITPAIVPLTSPIWARFVKMEWEGPTGNIRSIYEPRRISLQEVTHSANYYSIAAEWGDAYGKAGYEHGLEKKLPTITPIESTPDKPYPLIPNKTLSSAASVGEGWDDWLRIEPLETEKRIELKLQSTPFIKVAVDISDAAGNPINGITRTNGSQERSFTFMAEPNMEYRIHVYEPKRSIVFLWDVSGSMSSFVSSIENAILQFATAVNPKTEIVHLLPFEDEPRFLLKDWSGDPHLLSDTVRHYEAPDSSYAHMNLLAATHKLKDQRGTKAAIIITDCESSRNVNDKLWEALEDVRPVVFTFQTSDRTSQYRVEQDDMQDWASVAGGFYRSTRDASELDVAFEKVKAFLRRPAPYTLSYSNPELKPGFIEIKDARAKETLINPEQEGVLLIIDASASMREKLPDGQMKVTAAKQVIEQMVNEYLPAETNFGMRVFGHRGGEDCKSELMIPVAKLDPALVKEKLMFVRSSSLGNTSIGEGLSWAQEDLNAIIGQKRIVILTDGEETCHGDPAQAIAELAAQGMNVVVNIVGFTLGDESVKAQYSSWVKSTDGNYYDAQDAVALGEALQKAMTPQTLPLFNIIDKEGKLVATAQVGSAPIQVPSGKYTIEVLDPENPTTHEVEVMETKVSLNYK